MDHESHGRHHRRTLRWVTSTSGAGYSLAYRGNPDYRPAAEPSTMPLERSVVSPSLARVLVVEDEARVAAVLRDALTDLGYAVKIAGNGAEALGLVPVYQPDVVLLDLAMPGIPGEDVLKRLRQAHPHLPVVVVTGNLDADVARGTLTTGAFDYVSKPFDLEQLGRIVAAAVVYRS